MSKESVIKRHNMLRAMEYGEVIKAFKWPDGIIVRHVGGWLICHKDFDHDKLIRERGWT